MRLSTKLLLTTCVPPALIWLVGIYVVQTSQDQLRSTIQTAAMAEVTSVQEEIDRLLKARTGTWEDLVRNERVINALVRSNRELSERPDRSVSLKERAKRWSSGNPEVRRLATAELVDEILSDELASTVEKMKQLSGEIEVFREVILTNSYGAVVAQSRPVSEYLYDGTTWWKASAENGRYLGDVAVKRGPDGAEEVVTLEFCQRVDGEDGELIGMLRVEIDLQEVLEVVDSYARRGGRDRGMVLLNRDAKLIRIGGRGTTRALSDGSRYLVKNGSDRLEGTQLLERDASGREQVYTYAVPPQDGIVSSLGWVAVHTAEADTLLAPVRQLRNNVLLATVAATFLGVAVMLSVVFPVSRRMRHLVEATKKIGKGTNEQPIPESGRDELSDLSHEFNKMTVRLGEAQDKLRVAMRRAEEASRAKGDFLANMSHEIRTPMNAIVGITDLTLGTELSQEQRHYQLLVEQSAQALLMLLNDILDYSKIEAGKLELEQREFDLRDSVGDILQTLSPRAEEKNIELAFQVDPGVPRVVVGDLTRLRQVIVNLVGNALKFTDEGEVVVVVEEVARDGEELELLFKVHDTGIGVPGDRLETIFEVFAQADTSTTREFGGSGLGLAISKRIVEKMGGSISVESVEGAGSTFHFTGVFGAGAPETSQQSNVLQDLEGLPVLVVDDNLTHCEIVAGILRNWRMQVIVCPDGPSALLKMKETAGTKEEIKVAVIDQGVAGMDGIELAGLIRQQADQSKIPVIMLTTVSGSARSVEASGAFVVKMVSKPIKESSFLEAIVDALGLGAQLPRQRHDKKEIRPLGICDMKILLAEDGKVNQLVAVRLLERRGHRVRVADNGREAVELLRTEDFDAVLMDIQMPVMSGYEATREIRSSEGNSGRRVPIIAMTAHAMPGDREECLAAGMDDYVSKPIESHELYEVVERFASRSIPDEAVTEEEVRGNTPGDRDQRKEKRDISVFDPEAFRERIGDEALMCEMIRIFEEEVWTMWADLEKAEEDSDAGKLHEAAHRMRGLLGNYCAGRAWRCVSELDQQARGGELVRASAHLKTFQGEIELLEFALRTFREGLEARLQLS